MKNTDSLGRRSFVRGTLAALAAGAVTASGAAITVSILPDLIAARQRRHEDYLCAAAEQEVLIEAFEATLSPLVPVILRPDGRPREAVELRTYNPDYIEARIRETHGRMMTWIASSALSSVEEKACRLEQLAQSYDACNAALEQAIAADAALERNYGVEEACDRTMKAAEALQAATLAVLRHSPATPEEGAMKAEWLAAELGSRARTWQLDFREMQALVASIGRTA